MEEAKLFTQSHADINGHGVWHYLIDTPIGQINVVEYEGIGQEIKRFLFDGNHDKAERKYKAACRAVCEMKPYART